MKCGETIPYCASCTTSSCDKCKVGYILKNDKSKCLTDCT